eukprot:gene231-408_t
MLYAFKWSLACLLTYMVCFAFESVWITNIHVGYQKQIQEEHDSIGETALQSNSYCGFVLNQMNNVYTLHELSYHEALNTSNFVKLMNTSHVNLRHLFWNKETVITDLSFCLNHTYADHVLYNILNKFYTYFSNHPDTTNRSSVQNFIERYHFNFTIKESRYLNNIRFLFLNNQNNIFSETKKHERNTIDNLNFLKRTSIVSRVCSSIYLVLIVTSVFTFELYKLHNVQLHTQQKSYQRILHDLKTPISCIQSLIHDKSDIIKTMSTILTNRILTINITEIVPKYHIVHLKSYFHNLYTIYKPMVDILPNIDFRYVDEMDAEDCMYIDEDWTMRCVENCLSNSIKFTTSGYIQLRVSKTQEDLVIDIDDTGKGIPHEKRSAIIEDRIQLQNNSGGLGIGLSTVNLFLSKIQGRIDIVNNPDFADDSKGVRIRLNLPYRCPDYKVEITELRRSVDAVETAQVDEIKQNVQNMQTSNMFKLLLVEDDKLQRIILTNKLTKSGMYKVTEAVDGSHALTLCRNNRYDILLTDKSMPVMDGITLLRELQRSRNKPALCMMYSADCVDSETEMMRRDLNIDSIWDKTEGIDKIIQYIDSKFM